MLFGEKLFKLIDSGCTDDELYSVIACSSGPRLTNLSVGVESGCEIVG